jgi:hypothetical protein
MAQLRDLNKQILAHELVVATWLLGSRSNKQYQGNYMGNVFIREKKEKNHCIATQKYL